jgi:putative peptidoglycan lipid II flippase
MVPSVIAASAVQINVVVNSIFASFVGTEAIAWLNFAFRLMQLPIGVFGVAVATITLPVVSRIAASTRSEDFGPTLGKAMRLAVFLTLPSATGLYFLATPIIRLIYERGEFGSNDSLQTGLALQFYAMGLVSYACVKVLSPAFYAIDRKWTPMFVSFGAIGLNLVLNYLFIFRLGLGHKGLALATAISAAANFLCLYLLMSLSAKKDLHTPRLLGTLIRCGLASAALGAVCWAGLVYGGAFLASPRFWEKALSLFALIGMAAVAYVAVCFLLGVDEVRDAAAIVRRKILRKKS